MDARRRRLDDIERSMYSQTPRSTPSGGRPSPRPPRCLDYLRRTETSCSTSRRTAKTTGSTFEPTIHSSSAHAASGSGASRSSDHAASTMIGWFDHAHSKRLSPPRRHGRRRGRPRYRPKYGEVQATRTVGDRGGRPRITRCSSCKLVNRRSVSSSAHLGSLGKSARAIRVRSSLSPGFSDKSE